ncbi:MAG TPA: DUF1844 domain-containing protein [Kiritimatiellae bacterium]|nr:DUF1844 domain-containing protein [Kiritimatiellia bacterium]
MNNSHSSNQVGPELTPFSRLVAMLAGMALQHLGRIPDPATGRLQKRLADAQTIIDVIEDLQRKTRGNLEPGEESFLAETVTSLRFTFVAALNEEEAEQPPSGPKPDRPPAESTVSWKPEKSAPPSESPAGGKTSQDESKIRFRKSYG